MTKHEIIKAAAKSHGLTLRKLADLMGISSPNNLSRKLHWCDNMKAEVFLDMLDVIGYKISFEGIPDIRKYCKRNNMKANDLVEFMSSNSYRLIVEDMGIPNKEKTLC